MAKKKLKGVLPKGRRLIREAGRATVVVTLPPKRDVQIKRSLFFKFIKEGSKK